ncbi:MAG: EAL domain-containing protein [Methylophilaceae bacterium]
MTNKKNTSQNAQRHYAQVSDSDVVKNKEAANSQSHDIRTSEYYLRALLDTFPFIVWMKDKQNRFLKVNAKFAEIAGETDVKALEGSSDFDFWPEEMAQGYVNDDIEVLASGKAKTLVEQIRQSNGETFWAETYKSPVAINGEVIGTVGFARDISERKKLLSEIAKKELEYSSLVESLPLSIIRYDLSCKRIFANATERDFLSDNIQSLIGKTPMELWNANIKNMTGEQFQEKVIEVMRTAESQTFEIHCQSKDALYVNMLTLVPELDEQGAVIGALALASDITEMSQYRESLEHLAYHDPLTSLPNRTLLNQRMRQAIEYATKQQNHFGLLFIDLDYFKSINDTLGHAVGDELLKEAARRISACVRGSDLVARIGGDEFAILVLDVNHDDDLAGLAAKISEKLAEPFNIENISFFVTVSAGIACYPTDSDNIEDLMKYADTAMYQAKKQGRNNFQFYTPELTQNVIEHLAIATALRYAIKKNELSLHYQPKVNINTGKILGAEALLRWNGNVLGQVMPAKFIPIAEESGLINEIGDWVLLHACMTAVQINQDRAEPLDIAINISSKQFVGNNFLLKLQHSLRDTGCKACWINLEITESLLLQDSDEVLDALNTINEMGIKIAIDDFGTGYSALGYLNKFPISQVKIDRSFVNDICSDEKDALLVKAIIAMAHSLNKELVAEGIETKEQAMLIQNYGCQHAQGYLYSQPLSLPDFLQLLSEGPIKNH